MIDSMVTHVQTRRGAYHDSVTLLRITQAANGTPESQRRRSPWAPT